MLTWADGGALLAVLLWGVSFPVMKALMAVMDPLTLVVVLWLVALTILGAVLRLSGPWRLPAARELPALLRTSLVGFTLNQILYARGLHLTTASHAGLIFTLTPLVVFGLSWVLGQVNVRRRDLVGLGLGVGGAALIIGWPDPRASGEASVLGNLLMIGAATTWGVWTVLAAPILRRHGTLDGTFWISAAGTLGMVPFALPGLLARTGRCPGGSSRASSTRARSAPRWRPSSGTRPYGISVPRGPGSTPTWSRSSRCWPRRSSSRSASR